MMREEPGMLSEKERNESDLSALEEAIVQKFLQIFTSLPPEVQAKLEAGESVVKELGQRVTTYSAINDDETGKVTTLRIEGIITPSDSGVLGLKKIISSFAIGTESTQGDRPFTDAWTQREYQIAVEGSAVKVVESIHVVAPRSFEPNLISHQVVIDIREEEAPTTFAKFDCRLTVTIQHDINTGILKKVAIGTSEYGAVNRKIWNRWEEIDPKDPYFDASVVEHEDIPTEFNGLQIRRPFVVPEQLKFNADGIPLRATIQLGAQMIDFSSAIPVRLDGPMLARTLNENILESPLRFRPPASQTPLG